MEQESYLLQVDVPVVSSPSPQYRPCVAIVVINEDGLVLQAKRAGKWSKAWQFPQGGIEANETPLQACWRELDEETGLSEQQVKFIGHSKYWMQYDIPNSKHKTKGQIQAWIFLQLSVATTSIDLEKSLASSKDDEFEQLQWTKPADALAQVVSFKHPVYAQALTEFAQTKMQANSHWQEIS